MVFINEFHYDNGGNDTGEFIEIAGAAGTDLTGYSLVLYNGSPTQLVSYNTLALSGTIGDMGNGYGVISFSYPANGIQNGNTGGTEPDGIALVGPGNTVVQFLSYEGVFTAANGPAAGMTSVNVGVFEDGVANGTSIALTGSGTDYSDFTWVLDTDDTPGLVNNGQSFGSGPALPGFSISNVTQVEGDAGTSEFVFTITRTDSAGAASIDFTTNDGTATASSDYVAQSGTLNFVDGELTQTIAITVNGDTVTETNETFTVDLSNASAGYAIADAQGLGTIVNDDVTVLRIHDVQGAQHRSAYAGQSVTIQGIVTAVGANGFYIQEPDDRADGSIATSEAIYVFTNSAPPATVVVGNELRVSGSVSEYTPGGSSTGNLSLTELVSPSNYQVIGVDQPLPTAIILGEGGRMLPTEVIDGDGPFDPSSTANFDPVNHGMDFFESLEGMLVTVPTPVAVAGTNEFGEIFTVADNGANATGLSDRGTIVVSGTTGDGLNVTNTGPGSDFNPERIQIDVDTTITGAAAPQVDAGAVLDDVTGVLDYDFGNYQVIPVAPVTVATASTLEQEVTDLVGTQNQLTVASYNVLNLDINDDPSEGQADQDVADGRLEALARQIINNLGQPDIIGLQEVQDNSGGTDNGVIAADQVLQALVDKIVELGGPSYSFIDNTLITNNTGGGQPGANIRNVFLYNDDRVDLVEGSVRTTTDAAADFAGSRLPLVATFTFNGEDVTIINNHFSSKGGSTPLYGTTQPSVNGSAADRLVQAQNVADYVTALGGAKVVVLGDLNEFSNEESLAPLSNAGMTDMVTTLDPTERYTYSYEGNAQVLDHIFVSGNLSTITEYDVVHVNTEFAHTDATASDHDPSVIAIQLDQISFTGTELADYLVGNGADNELFGLAGDDRLFGGAGDDIMHGGAGNDIYYVDSAGDRIVEGSREGTDLVFSTVDYSLMGAHVEYLSLIGDADIAGTGNNQANAIAGNDGDNIINGMGGADVLTGRGGADMFLFTMKPTATNIDRITDFTVADDTIGLDRSIFRAGPAGELRDFNFHVGAAAADAQDRIIYNDVTGDLMYDADGTGSIAAVVFARIDPGLALTHADFVMI